MARKRQERPAPSDAMRDPATARQLMRFMRFEVDGGEAEYRQVACELGLRFVALAWGSSGR
jgi:hypothetical protein